MRNRILLLILFGISITVLTTVIIKYINQKRYSPFLSLQLIQGKEHIVPIAIVGSGCAGLSSAVYAARGKVKTIVIMGNLIGGQLSETTWVENWPGSKKELGPEIINKIKQQAQTFGAEFLQDAITRVDFSSWPYQIWTEDGKKMHALTLIIATGASPKKLGIPGEKEYWGKGVTTCAICDAPFHKGNDVIVVGGGDSAAEEALQLAPYAKTVTIVVRKNKMRASVAMQDRIKAIPNISISYNTEVKKIIGNEHEVTSVQLFNNKTNQTDEKQVTGVFLAIGHDPNSTVFKDALKTVDQGYIWTQGKSQKTSMPGVFAAGDIEDNVYRQAGVAAGSGIKAALDALAFLQDIGFNDQIAKEFEGHYFDICEFGKVEIPIMKNASEFETILKTAKLPVFVDFYTEFCPSCIQMFSALEATANKFCDKVIFVKIDANELKDIAQRYRVGSVPCMLVFKNGNLVSRYNEAMSKKQLYDFVQKFI